MKERINQLLQRFHRSQSGAVALLCMAGLLIIFLTAMMMYDAGQAAQDKVDVQVGADTAALSHATIRARGMNMVAYANITKKILYGYNTLYVSAFLALVEVTSYYLFEAGKNAAEAIRGIPLCVTIVGCAVPLYDAYQAVMNAIEGVKGIIQLVLEIIELTTVNGPRLFGMPGTDQGRSIVEVTALDYYQEYISKMNPWWAWGEAVTRGMRNGSTLVGTWPIPNGKASKLRDKIRFGLNALNTVFSSIPGADDIVGTTYRKDELPIEQIPEAVNLGPWFDAIGVPRLAAHIKMCGSTLLSPEFWLMQYYFDHWRDGKSEGYWRDTSRPSGAQFAPQTLITLLEIVQLPVGCTMASLTLGHEVLPYDIKARGSSLIPRTSPTARTNDQWLRMTANVAFGYRKGDGRFDDSGQRSKMEFMTRDYDLAGGGAFFRNDGYWAVSKAEMVYDTGILGDLSAGVADFGANGVPSPFGDVLGGALTFINDWINEPSMWAPRWTSRQRPLALPQEDNLEDMDHMFHDSLPFMALTTPLALAYGDGGGFPSLSQVTNWEGQVNGALGFLQNFARDVMFMEMASDGYVVGKQQGGWEK